MSKKKVIEELQGAIKLVQSESVENITLEAYFSAMCRWIDDSDGWFANFDIDEPDDSFWELFAEIITAGIYYE